MERQLAALPALAGGGDVPMGLGPCRVQGLGREEEEEGRMELPLGGQFRSTVWDGAVGKEDFTQPPL